MNERPILFSASMVRAVLADNKRQTRRVVKPQPSSDDIDNAGDGETIIDMATGRDIRCPYGAPGDRLWVRECWTHDADSLDECRAAFEDASPGIGYGPYYRATEVAPDTLRWKPSIFMPRWASRITLEVTEVRVQRLQEITEDDARAEGAWTADCVSAVGAALFGTHRGGFSELWDRINGRDGRRWTDNPFVWAITFKRLS